MEISDAEPGRDAAACAAIYAPFVAETAVSFEEVAPDAAAMAQRIAATQQTYPWLVARAEQATLGYAYATAHRARPAYRWAAEVSVYVAAEHRGRGFGRAMYAALLGLLARQGIHTACAGITLPNPASVDLHEAVGFTPVGVYREIGFKAGAWYDVGWWQCRLREADAHPAPPGPPPRVGGGDPHRDQ